MASQSSTQNTSNNQPTLARTMGLGALIVYGVGDMLGAGVYGLIGETAREMGNAVWLAFVASMVAALLTGLSYASLGSRYPRAGGVAVVTQRAFGVPFVSYVIGLAVVVSGLTSFATGARAFAGYFDALLQGSAVASKAVPLWIVLGYVVLLTLINLRGMKESTWMNALCTFIELTGLAIVILVGVRYWGGVNLLEVPPLKSAAIDGASSTQSATQAGSLSLGLALQGAILTFYSFLGFEDLMNVSEEVKEPERNFPRGIIIALLITT
ncbi:MAG TPA: amino acid permease, partial [Abditibacteriaceae bacterium]|nr:amino acid permease [Abditibacteriaceae bacterium]